MSKVEITATAHGILNPEVVEPRTDSSNAVIGYRDTNGNSYELDYFAADSEELFDIVHISIELDSETASQYSEEELQELVQAEAEELVTKLVSSEEELELQALAGCRVAGDELYRNVFDGENILLLQRVEVSEVKVSPNEQ